MQKIFAFVLVLVLIPTVCVADRSHDNIDGDCRNIVPAPDVNFEGQTLRDAPDIVDPKLRQINALVNESCFAAAANALAKFEKEHPTEFRASFVRARIFWIYDEKGLAKTLLHAAVEKNPDFASGYLLLGSMALGEMDYATASRMLSATENQSPTNLWLFIDKLVLEARTIPTRAVVQRLIKVAKDPQFPGNVRQSAAEEVKLHGDRVDPQDLDEIYRTEISFESSVPLDQKMVEYAAWLVERQERTEDARRILHSVKTDDKGVERRRQLLLAESYLFDALKIDPVQTQRNFALIEKAKNELGGDLGQIASHATLDPYLSRLKGFLSATEDVDVKNEFGETGLCRSMMAIFLDVEYVNGLLENLADPNQICSATKTPPLGMIVTRGDQTDKRILILKELLRSGADPNPKIFDGHEDIKMFCADQPVSCEETLPILQAAWATSPKNQ